MKTIFAFSFLFLSSFFGMLSAYGLYGNNNTTSFYDQWGSYRGSAREGYNGRVDYYDQWGSCTGTSRENPSGSVDYYDQWGTYQGSSR